MTVASSSRDAEPNRGPKLPYLAAAGAIVIALILAVAWFDAFQKMGRLTLLVVQLEEQRQEAVMARDWAIETLIPTASKLLDAEMAQRQSTRLVSEVMQTRGEMEALLNELAEAQHARMSMGWQLSMLSEGPEHDDDRNRLLREIAECERGINGLIVKAAELHYQISTRQAEVAAIDRKLADELVAMRTTLKTRYRKIEAAAVAKAD